MYDLGFGLRNGIAMFPPTPRTKLRALMLVFMLTLLVRHHCLVLSRRALCWRGPYGDKSIMAKGYLSTWQIGISGKPVVYD